MRAGYTRGSLQVFWTTKCPLGAHRARDARIPLHLDAFARDVYWQMLGGRSEAETFQCLAWLYDGFTLPPAEIITETGC